MSVCLLENKREEILLNYNLNEIYSGLHGIVKSLLQTTAHYFLVKEKGNNQLANTLIKKIVDKLECCFILTALSEKIGVQVKILNKKENVFKNYIENKKFYKRHVSAILIEQVLCDILIIKGCEKVIGRYKNQNVISALEQIVKKTKQGLDETICIYNLRVFS